MSRVPPPSRPLFLAIVWLAVSAIACHAEDGKFTDKPAIQELYTRLSNAMRAKDMKTIASLGTPDFTATDASGKVYNARQSLAMMESDLRSMKRINAVKPRIRSIALDGKKATTVAEMQVSAVMVQGGKPHDMKSTSVSKDTLVKTAKGWKFKSVVSLSADVTMDGRKVTVPPPGKKKRPTHPSEARP